MSGVNVVGGMGGMLGIGIEALAALAVINMVGNTFQCGVCGRRYQNRRTVMSHMTMVHPEQVAQAQAVQHRPMVRPRPKADEYLLGMPRRTRRTRSTDWVWDIHSAI